MADHVAVKIHSGGSHVIPLLDCPFCGSPAEFLEYVEERRWGARCTNCPCIMGGYSSRLDLCRDWNKRISEGKEKTEEEWVDLCIPSSDECIGYLIGYVDVKHCIEKGQDMHSWLFNRAQLALYRSNK